MRHRITRALGAAALSTTLALSLASCGDDGGGTAATELSTTEHNEADVAFASDMLQHHAQALSMVDLTLDRPLDPEVQQLAEEIREAQGTEIELFADWLSDWNEEIPATVRDHANAHSESDDSGGMADMPGMMSAGEMDALAAAPDSTFQTQWLQMMIEHHRGALEMARAEQEDGRFQDAVDLAAEVEATQTREIETMEGLLGS